MTFPHPRTEPADLARSRERRRERFLRHLHVDPSPWRIAKLVAAEARGSWGEGLRGVFVPAQGGPGSLRWWPSHVASHQQGRDHLGLDHDRTSTGLLEVEANVDRDSTIFFQFGVSQDDARSSALVDAFLAHPTVSEQIGGCLARNGRLLLAGPDGKIRMADSAPDDPFEALRLRRLARWQALGRRAAGWARSRAATIDDGRPMPDRRALATFRSWLRDGNSAGMYGRVALPDVLFEEDAVVAVWRGCDLMARLEFRGGSMSARSIQNGRWRETGPVDVSTPSRMWRRAIHPESLHMARDADPEETRP